MKRVFLLLIVLSILATGFACGGSAGVSGDTPTEAYKRLFTAVKSKDIEAIKKQLTKKSIEFGAMAAQRNSTPLEKIYENGFTATTFSDSLPNIRDERVKEGMASIEVWNSKESRWEDLPFVLEDGAWKLGIGELFTGSFKSPGKGRDQIEKEAANALANTSPPGMSPNSNTMPTFPTGPTANRNAK